MGVNSSLYFAVARRKLSKRKSHLTPMILLLAGSVQLNTSWSCEEAFEEFVDRFNKSYEDGQLAEARDNFCENYKAMLKLIKKGTCIGCNLTPVMDRKIEQLTTPDIVKASKEVVTGDSQVWSIPPHYTPVPHAVKLWWPDNLHLYTSVDLREYDLQGKVKDQTMWCGSCWAFGITGLFEGLILLDQEYGLPVNHTKWRFTAENCSLSEQFIMSNMWGAGNYCWGGNFIYGLEYINRNFETVEWAKNIQNDFPKYFQDWKDKKKLNPVLNQSDFYLPFVRLYQSDYTNRVLIQVYDSREPIGKNATARNQVMQLISRGIPVCGAAHITPYLISYRGGGHVLYQGCPGPDYLNHQVLFTGYGKKHGKNVWLIKNSWSEHWGDKGYFMVEQGTDSFCTEHYFYTALPQFYQSQSRTNPLPDPKRRRGHESWELDFEIPHLRTPDPNPNDKSGFALSYALVIGSSLVAVCVGAIIAVAIAFINRRKKRVYRVKQEQVYSIE